MQITQRLCVTGLLISVMVTLAACSGVDVQPGDTMAFEARQLTTYAWRNAPFTEPATRHDRLQTVDPVIRSAVNERMQELGYREVARENAGFLVDYVAAIGFNEGQLSRAASPITPYSTGTINRQMDGASVDNAYALSGVVETGNLLLVFLDAKTIDPLWQVRISSVIEDANRVNERALGNAVRQGLATVPEAPLP